MIRMRLALALLLTSIPAAADTQIAIGGYLEALYQAHFQNPSNQVTNLRGFDNRSRTFTLSNVALDAKGEHGSIATRVVLQIGSTGSTYYTAEPDLGAQGTTAASNGDVWKYIQTATVTAELPHAVTIEAGLLPSPVGLEVIPIKDNWNWSRSNLFFGLPFYHTGLHVSRPLAGRWTAKLHVYNGWNSVVDNNVYPSAGGSIAYASLHTSAQLLYLGGIERAADAPEGDAWRHLFDALVQHAITDEVSVAAQADAGLERNDIGASWWAAGALYGKLAIADELYVAARADYFRERVPAGAASIFWPVRWVASGTATLGYQPATGVSLRLEYRHDHASGDVFFGGTVASDPLTTQPIANRDRQDTATVGITAWF